ncbi:HNH endonuclease [Methylobacterium oryzae]|uniref:HNH endonuclease n=1 Tax=Methylobacterium oryzae TaxID=334852 RepID=UPI002F2D9D60
MIRNVTGKRRIEVGRCHYCDGQTFETQHCINGKWQRPAGQVSPNEATIDHVIPKSQGGNSYPANLVLCCHTCNQEKGNKPYDEFVEIKRGAKEAFQKFRDTLELRGVPLAFAPRQLPASALGVGWGSP